MIFYYTKRHLSKCHGSCVVSIKYELSTSSHGLYFWLITSMILFQVAHPFKIYPNTKFHGPPHTHCFKFCIHLRSACCGQVNQCVLGLVTKIQKISMVFRRLSLKRKGQIGCNAFQGFFWSSLQEEICSWSKFTMLIEQEYFGKTFQQRLQVLEQKRVHMATDQVRKE